MSNPNEGAAWPIADAAMTQVCRIPFSLLASHRLTEMYRKSWTSSSLPATTASSRRVLTRLPSLCLVEPPRSVLYLHKTLSCITTQRTDESDSYRLSSLPPTRRPWPFSCTSLSCPRTRTPPTFTSPPRSPLAALAVSPALSLLLPSRPTRLPI